MDFCKEKYKEGQNIKDKVGKMYNPFPPKNLRVNQINIFAQQIVE